MDRVAILGASAKEGRYANLAQRMLMEAGYAVAPVSPTGREALGCAGYVSLDEVEGAVDTVTVYVGSDRVPALVESLLRKRPRRVIFNPGTENAAAERALAEAGIEVLEACTLVMLRTGQF